MPSLISLAPEILHLIFRALQSSTSGPRYVLTPPATETEQARWRLTDAGPLYLAATCRALRDVYRSRYIASNLVLEIPEPPEGNEVRNYQQEESFFQFWNQKERNGNLLQKLQRMRRAAGGKPLTRFVLDLKWRAWPYPSRRICEEMWGEILGDVSAVFGDELMVVICSQGEKVEKDFRRYAPKKIRELEDMSKSLRGEEEVSEIAPRLPLTPEATTRSLRTGSKVLPKAQPVPEPLNAKAAPLALHIYAGYGKHGADQCLDRALAAFGSKNLRSLYFSSDPNNFRLVGHSRRPAEGQQLYKLTNPYLPGNPWRHFLPSWSSACDSIEEITLDCFLFWSELAYTLPYCKNLKKLDSELMLMATEPVYPFSLESKESAGNRVLRTCELKDALAVKEIGLKKNRGKEWLSIQRVGIVVPRIEPEVRQCLMGDPHSRFATVDMKVCMQVARRRIARSRRG